MRAYLSLGSNLGDRMDQLREAVRIIDGSRDTKIERVSSVYETEPIGGVPQQNFYNVVVEISTDLSPRDLLVLARMVEARLKRRRKVRWGPRTIDVDILIYGDTVIDDEDLTIPHAEMLKRVFVLVPLLEVAPDLRLPDGRMIRWHLEEVSGQVIEKIGSLA
ncbi:MAG: 2-amino-4-hydroxy-6-hydroxymethyldihydropteridine diphosphokinase [Actinobacteria bacterium]|nr:2-amino-4-hydroxy-6-hydroxymethyldihydropteridine diphosphokinase [Actinomycetota bacterium]